ncbi:MAG: SH3 domain-containing protein [Lachnospiraceae bacterium]|nr:SH3 domain-containing protein [Lachnospiraceae bacterium]
MEQIGWFFQNLSARLRKDRRFAGRFWIGCLAVVLVVVVIIVLASCGKDEEDADKPGNTQDAAQTAEEVDYTPPSQEELPLEEDAHPDVNELVTQYLTAVAAGDTATVSTLKQPIAKEELIKVQIEAPDLEGFNNIKVYTKNGPLPNTYVAIIYYEIKFKNIDQMAPGMTTYYIMPKADGSLCINGGDIDPRVEDYLKAVVAHDDVKELLETVNTRYSEAIEASNALKSFMEVYSSNVEQKVSEQMAAEQAAEAGGEGVDAAAAAPTEQICTAIETVNVRSSDSENGEKIGKLQQGEKVTRYEELENGWSRVSYNGSEAFVKSEFLKVDEAPATDDGGEASAETQEGGEAAAPAETTSTTTAADLEGKSTVTAKESVNVRKSASQDSEKIGVAYQGEHFKLLQAQGDGWCKIEFNGQTGYVKTEFVE